MPFPVRVPLRYEAGPLGPITVAAEGRGPGGTTVTGGAQAFYFEVGETLTIPVTLVEACRDVSCGAGERCEDGRCVSDEVPDGGPGAPDLGQPDLGVDMGRPPICDPGAAVCECSLTGCDGNNCDCENGCACDLTCPPGQDCDHLHCKDADTECTIDAAGGSNIDVNCDGAWCTDVNLRDVSNADVRCHKDDACCIVDCRGASNCRVSCESGAYCRLDCGAGADENCRFEECWADENPLDCGGGVFVCGAARCPDDRMWRRGTEPDD